MFAKGRAVTIRPAWEDDAPTIARVHIKSWQAAYRGILPDSFLDALEPSPREERWREALRPSPDGRFTFVAELPAVMDDAPAEITGFSSGGPERDGFVADGVAYDGEVYAIYLVPQHQRQGIGRRLVKASTQELLEQGAKSIVIWALRDNQPARAFYEALGGALVGEKTVTIGPSNLVDVAYGWPVANLLLERAEGMGRPPGAMS